MKKAIRLSGSLLCLVCLFVFVEPLLHGNGRFPVIFPYAVTIALVAATAGICVGIHTLVTKHMIRLENKVSRFVIQGILLLGIVTVFFMLRMPEMQRIAVEKIATTEYYQMATIGTANPDVSMNISQNAYTNLNSALFLFLGNKEVLMPLLQMLCQLVLLVTLYCANNILTGFIAGVIPALVVAVSPVFTQNIQTINPHSMTAMLFGIWFLLFALYTAKEEPGKLNYAKLIGLGIATGYFMYIWVFAVVGVLMVWMYIAMKSNDDFKQKITDFMIYSLFCVGIYALLWLVSSGNVASIFVDYNSAPLLDEMRRWGLSHGILTLGGILFIVSGLWNKEANNTILFVTFAGVIASYFAGFGYGESASMSMFYQIAMALMAGSGLQQLFHVEKETASDAHVYYAGVNMGLLSSDAANVSNEVSVLNMNTEAIKSVDINKPVENKPVENKQTESDSPQKPAIQFIENPLPLPKKHEKRVMDYAFEPRPEQMHYDVELTSRNNFYDI